MSVTPEACGKPPFCVVQLQPGCWLAYWSGDPGRTTKLDNAKHFKSAHAAVCALQSARRFRPLAVAFVYQLDNDQGVKEADPASRLRPLIKQEHPRRIERIARDLGNVAEAWEADACLLGSVQAEEIRDLCKWDIEQHMKNDV